MNLGFVTLAEENDDYKLYRIYRPGTIYEDWAPDILGRTWGDDHNVYKTKEDEVKDLKKIINEIQTEIDNGTRPFLEVTEYHGEYINFYQIKNNLMKFFEPSLEYMDDLYMPHMSIEEIKKLISTDTIDLPEILKAYIQTEFLIEDLDIKIKNGKTHKKLSQFLEYNNKKNFCIITAHNPYPELLSDEENKERNDELEESLESYDKISVLGLSTSEDHPDEASFLVFEIDLETAMKLMQEYEQLAIVYGDKEITSLIVNPNKINEIE
jgi:hypothetical protein